MVSKLCANCGLDKPLDRFHRDRDKPDGKATQCKSCKRPGPYFSVRPACKLCIDCGIEKPIENFTRDNARIDGTYLYCTMCKSLQRLFRVYGVDRQKFFSMLADQGNRCPLCAGMIDMSTAVVDHCHATGAVRELLCWTCNAALGHFNDDPDTLDRASAYLRRHKELHMTLVYGLIVDVTGTPVRDARVTAVLSSAGVAGDTIVSTRRNIRANRFGYWEMDLVPNSDIEPNGTYYIVRHLNAKMYISVPDTNNPTPVNSIIISIPNSPLSLSTYVNDVGGYYGSIPAETIQAMVGAVGEGSTVSSVDGRVGIVTLGDKYATLLHNHDGQYSGISHNHDSLYSAISHDHAGVYADLVHSHSGYSVVGHTHAAYSLATHDHDETYVKIGEETVTSVNGQTGDVVISGGGGGAVDSVDGRTGTVTLNDLYSGVSHNHDSSYAGLSHNHDSSYSATGHTHTYPVTSVDGQTGAVSLSSSYAASGHNHTGVYSPVAHNHDASYATAGHTHSYPVTSVDGLTGAVSLSSTYAASGHNHSGVYSVTSHNHDSAYSATGHTHSYPVTSVDGLTGAVSLSSTYAASAHNHNSSYATLAHTHTELTAGSWASATMTSGVGGTLQYRSEPAYGVIRIRTNGRLYAASGSFGAGSTLATLPVGSRPATEIKWVMYQGAEPTQNLIILKLSTAGALTIVNSISLSGTQSSGIVIDHTFATS